MKKYKSAKITGIIFAVLIFSLVVNILYLGATGKHLISEENIASFAKNRSKKEVVEYAQRGQRRRLRLRRQHRRAPCGRKPHRPHPAGHQAPGAGHHGAGQK